MVDNSLFEYMDALIRSVPRGFKRYLYDRIDWNARLVGLVGPRGIGKSTLLLQRLLETRDQAESLYVSADNLYFARNSLIDLADEFVKDGGTRLYIDEVHKYEGWSRELKQIYDVHPELSVVFTGSSILDIRKGEADLSRRALVYPMQGLSFREYLELFKGIQVPVRSLEEILRHEVILPEVRHPLPLFREYLRNGYYPFALEGGFAMRMSQVVAQTVEVDIPMFASMRMDTARKLRRLLSVIATMVPFKPVGDTLSQLVGVSKNNVGDYLVMLEKAGLIGMLRDGTGGIRSVGKVEKIYLDNPSLAHAVLMELAQTPNIGTIRETFFFNQMRVNNAVTLSPRADFRIGDSDFEVGGKGKGQRQIEGSPYGFVVKDDIEVGHGNIIPLWYFGFNY